MNGSVPTARDGHTLSVVDSKLVVFGGRGNTSAQGQGTILLGDSWEIDVDPALTASVGTNVSTVSPVLWLRSLAQRCILPRHNVHDRPVSSRMGEWLGNVLCTSRAKCVCKNFNTPSLRDYNVR